MNTSEITVIIGQRLRARRLELGYSQSLASEKADLHPTYIGQLERGEKNATIVSIEKLCTALDLPMEELFANIAAPSSPYRSAQKCYDLIVNQPIEEHERIYCIIEDIIKYKNN
ncbi:MAG: helix-turn-helix transcriptional regulator [Lachnospiraceae bacterium]|nr:helix-turn-helix transcriptional regulator [Lachnospiraceae bacterium]